MDLADKYHEIAKKYKLTLITKKTTPLSDIFDTSDNDDNNRTNNPMTETNNTTNNQIDIVDNTNGLYKVNDVFYTASDGSAKELFGVRR